MQTEDGVAVINARVGKVHVCWPVGARSAGDNKLLCGDGLDGAVMALQRQGVLINEMGVALQDLTVVTLVKSLPHPRLLINNVISMVKDVGKRGAEKSGVIAVKRILVKFNDAANGVAEGFRRDSAPVGATTANIMVALYHRYPGSLFYQTHCSAFAARAGTNNYCVVIVGVWHGKAYLFLYIKAT